MVHGLEGGVAKGVEGWELGISEGPTAGVGLSTDIPPPPPMQVQPVHPHLARVPLLPPAAAQGPESLPQRPLQNPAPALQR